MSDFTEDEMRVLKEIAQDAIARRDFKATAWEAARAACDRGEHAWIRHGPRAVRPYCNRCGTEKKP